jgi:hypothetical protein
MATDKKDQVEKVEATAPPANENSATPTPVKPQKSHTALIIVIVLIIVLGLPALGIGAFWYFVGNKIDDATEQLENGEVNINLGDDASINTTSNQKWPTTLPTEVPEFDAGEIISSGNYGDIWSIMIEGATKADIIKYQNTLVAAGWTAEEPLETEGMGSYSATKNGYGVNITLTTDEDGTTNILFTVGKEPEA